MQLAHSTRTSCKLRGPSTRTGSSAGRYELVDSRSRTTIRSSEDSSAYSHEQGVTGNCGLAVQRGGPVTRGDCSATIDTRRPHHVIFIWPTVRETGRGSAYLGARCTWLDGST
jgi:hypothetical protein